jgi:phage tail sheath protein FI
MAFQVSPGVNVSEIDLTGIVPAVSTAIGAIAGRFTWGPMSKRILVDSEEVLAANFGKPNSDVAEEWFTAADFLSYANQLWVVRLNNSANNATASELATLQILNEDDYDTKDDGTTIGTGGEWIAKWPGALGNSLKVSLCQSANTWESTPAGAVWNFAEDSLVANTTSANVALVLSAGDFLYFANSTAAFNLQVASVGVSTATTTRLTLVEAPSSYQLGASTLATDAGVVKRRWEYYNAFDAAPATSVFATGKSGSGDEVHVVVEDEDGEITGVPGSVIERFAFVSRAFDAKTEDGATNYYKTVINDTSNYIWWGEHYSTILGMGGLNASLPASTTFVGGSPLALSTTISLKNGGDGIVPTAANVIDAYDKYADAEEVDVSLILTADAGGVGNASTVTRHIIQNICETRKDCIALVSPERGDVVDNALFVGSEAEDIVTYRNLLPSTSYGFMDSGWKYTYDKYNDVYRYIPLNGAVGGTMALTDAVRDPWWSPAGYNRGNIRNSAKLAYNPRKAHRDLLYKSGINPVVTFTGEGTVLYGDKTMLTRPSAFDRVNVRRLFIVLEKSIATAAKYMLFEFNDGFTRASFRNLVEPFLRDVQGRRGIYDFRVVCDETNNTPEIIDRNEFVGDIYIKPARSINFIQLNFIAVRTGVEFDEVVGQF